MVFISENGRAALFLFNNGKVKIYRYFFDTLRMELGFLQKKIITEMQNDWEYKQKERWEIFLSMGMK